MNAKKIKVCHIITMLELGGAQRNTLYTCATLDKNKFDVFLVCGTGGILDNETRNIRTYFVKQLIRKINPFLDTIALIRIYKILKKEKPDIVHTHSSKAGILGRTAAYLLKKTDKKCKNLKIIHTIHGFGFHDFQPYLVKLIYVILERITAKMSNKLIAVSSENITKGLKNKIASKEKYIVIRSGIKLQDYYKTIDVTKKRTELGINNEFVVGMVACFKQQKAPLDFVTTAYLVKEKLPSVKFILVGDGILRTNIIDYIKKLSLEDNIILTGWRTDINEIMKVFDIFILTSLWEGLPRTVIEAMASGIPVIATSVDGTKEIVQDGKTGFLVAPHDTGKMAEKIIQLLKNTEERKHITESAKQFIAEFDIDKMVKDQENLYLFLTKKLN